MSSMTVPDECNPKATFLLLNPWAPFRSYVNQRVPFGLGKFPISEQQ